MIHSEAHAQDTDFMTTKGFKTAEVMEVPWHKELMSFYW